MLLDPMCIPSFIPIGCVVFVVCELKLKKKNLKMKKTQKWDFSTFWRTRCTITTTFFSHVRISAIAIRLCLRNLTVVKIESKTGIFRFHRRNAEYCSRPYISGTSVQWRKLRASFWAWKKKKKHFCRPPKLRNLGGLRGTYCILELKMAKW